MGNVSNRFMKRILSWKLQAMNSLKFFSCSCLLTPVDVRMGWLKQMENASLSGFEQKIRIDSWRDHGQAYQRTNSLNVGNLNFLYYSYCFKVIFFLFYFPQFPFRSLQKTTLKLFNFKRSGARVIVVNLSLMHSTPHGESNRSKPWAQSQE